MSDLAAHRRFYAEEIEAVANLTSPQLIDALATVPRERFVGDGPWVVFGEASGGSARTTIDSDPRRVYHNYAIGLDPGRQLFNGVPALIASAIDRFQLQPGQRVLHIGTGTGYYTALAAHTVGPTGRVLGIEVDGELASRARQNLADRPWVTVETGDGRGPFRDRGERFDAILVNAGVTHPEPAWLDAVETGGRIIMPLTATMPAPPSREALRRDRAEAHRAEAGMGTIGKGLLLLLARQADGAFTAQVLTFVAIYSAIGLRSDELNRRIGETLQRTPFPRLTRLRRDVHEPDAACWLHSAGCCLRT
jgi:protein-L-isoaspartate(D-aspartate) O-methyltransferase